MSEIEQLLSQINSGQMSSQRLKELQEMANAQLLRYEQGLTAITKNGDAFTFEDYKEALRLASGGNQDSISRSEWDQVTLFLEKRLKLRDQLIDTIKQGQQQFVTIKAAIDTKLSPKRSGCFIATAAYGSALQPDVLNLRSFRDNYLHMHKQGRYFISLYERYSPPIANFIHNYFLCRLIVRSLIVRPLIFMIKIFYRREI